MSKGGLVVGFLSVVGTSSTGFREDFTVEEARNSSPEINGLVQWLESFGDKSPGGEITLKIRFLVLYQNEEKKRNQQELADMLWQWIKKNKDNIGCFRVKLVSCGCGGEDSPVCTIKYDQGDREEFLDYLSNIARATYDFIKEMSGSPVCITNTGHKPVFATILSVASLFDNVTFAVGVEASGKRKGGRRQSEKPNRANEVGQDAASKAVVHFMPSFPVSLDISKFSTISLLARLNEWDKLTDRLRSWQVFQPVAEELAWDPSTLARLVVIPSEISLVGNHGLKEFLKEVIPIFHHMWHADRIPETVQHSSEHSRRIATRYYYLVESGVLDLLDIPEDRRDIFSAAILLAAYAHDIGHTVAFFEGKPVMWFPQLVRDFHHIYTYDLMEQMERRISQIKEWLGSSDDLRSLWDYVKLISLFHRKHMVSHSGSPAWEKFQKRKEIFKKLFGLQVANRYFKPAEDWLKDYPKTETIWILKAIWLFKLLDEMDVQVDRSVDKNFMTAAEFVRSMEISGLERYLTGKAEGSEEKITAESIARHLSEKENWLEDMDFVRRCMIAFKKEQKGHFEKHRAVMAVFPWVDWDSNEIVVRILPSGGSDKIEGIKRDIEEQAGIICKEAESLGIEFPHIGVKVVGEE